MASKTELQELLDSPNETLSAEYKEWLELADNNEAKASTARHIAALSNFGGGYLIFGITDALEFAGPNPFPQVTYSRDQISSVVKRYLEPAFQCDVHNIVSAAGNTHPVVVVPPHGAVPICAKASGPEVKGQAKGIVRGTYYTRKPGPESAPITTEAEWLPIIRRCVMHERASILGAIDAALRGARSQEDVADALRVWHDAARAVFLKDIAERQGRPEWAKWHWQASYAIERSDGQRLEPGSLVEVLRQVNLESKELIDVGWSAFFPFTRSGIEPHFRSDPASGEGEEDFLETALMRDPQGARGRHPDLWRVSPNGKATIVRDYWEDDPGLNKQLGKTPGTWLSPQMAARDLAETVKHARGLSERFAGATTVYFRCEWRGLEGRRFHDPQGLWMDYHISGSDQRVANGAWPVGALASAWHEIVAELAAPLIRAFTTDWRMSPAWVLGQAKKWK